MSDQTLSITAEQFAALSPDAQTTLDAQLARSGFSEEQRASLKNGAPSKGGAPSKPATEQLVQPSFTVNSKPPSDARFNPPPTTAGNIPIEQRISAFQKLRGVVDEATLKRAAAEEGIAWNEVVKEAPAQTPQRLTLQQANDKLQQTTGPLAAGSDASDYSFQFQSHDIADMSPDEVADVHGNFARSFHTAGVPLSLSQGLFRTMMDAGHKFGDMDEVQQMLTFKEEGERLRRLGNVDQIVSDHAYAWSRLPEDFRQVAMEQRLFHTAEAFKALADAGQLMRVRASRGGK